MKMVDWKQENNKQVEWVASDPDCYTGFKSNVNIIGPDSQNINVSLNEQTDDGVIPTWENLEGGSKIEWDVLTESEDEGKSDRFSIELSMLDGVYVARVVNEAMNELTDEQIGQIMTNPDPIIELITERVGEKLKPELAMKTIYSAIFNTDSTGIAHGEIEIPPQWPKGAYNLMFHYGYHAQSEKDDFGWDSKAMDFWFWEMGPMIAEIVIHIILFVFTGGASLAVSAVIFSASIIADLAYMQYRFNLDGYGLAGLNKYDCVFPQTGWNHIYGFGYETEDAAEEMDNEIDLENMELIAAMDNYIATRGLVASVGTGIIGITLLMIILSKMKGGGN